ncbi:FkbM family methyltransferase [Sinorhizobium fredii]|uniref:FkbM family methyltransferase n=1 Tax=Rhizobium fredii TaxID=380 RepID=UPI0004B4AB67|nr:FkbM family methyltransferase [Sinorhizobium fredii]AWI57197.1 hypothetical protein AB395_00001538 [Sinorhizobium fredii CCBAU 45436]
MRMPIKDVTIPDAAGGRIGGTLRKGRWYEQEMLQYISSLCLRGTYLDIGANIGNHSVYFATNTKAEQVCAFEPSPVAISILNAFIEANKLGSLVEVMPFAASDRDGFVEFVTALGKAPARAQSKRLDDCITSPVALIKMDIEGAEPAALRGAVRILRESKPVMFIEIHDDEHMTEIMSIIGPIGYRPTGKVWNPSPTYEFSASR